MSPKMGPTGKTRKYAYTHAHTQVYTHTNTSLQTYTYVSTENIWELITTRISFTDEE